MIESRFEKGIIIIKCPEGFLDIMKTTEMNNAIFVSVNEHPGSPVIIDMRYVKAMCSFTLKVFLDLKKSLKEIDDNLDISMCNVNKDCMRILDVAYLIDFFNIRYTVGDSMEFLKEVVYVPGSD